MFHCFMLRYLMMHYFPGELVVAGLLNFVLFQYFTIKCCTISLLHYINVALFHIALLMLYYLNFALFAVAPFNVVPLI